MIVYNTTFHADRSVEKDFLDWLKREFVPRAVECGRLSEPRLMLVMNAAESDGTNYSLQFRVADMETLEAWYGDTGCDLVELLSRTFGDRVAGFSTLLEEMDL